MIGGAVVAGIMAGLARTVSTWAGRWIVQILLFFGVQVVATKLAIAPMKAMLSSAFSGMPADVLAWISYIRVDAALTIVLSAYAAAAGTRFLLSRPGA